jgi:hypothetical protein
MEDFMNCKKFIYFVLVSVLLFSVRPQTRAQDSIAPQKRALIKELLAITEAHKVSESLYDKYFSENELKDLISFYKSPTGMKAIKTLPQLAGEATAKSSELLTPRITKIVDEILEEERKKWK